MKPRYILLIAGLFIACFTWLLRHTGERHTNLITTSKNLLYKTDADVNTSELKTKAHLELKHVDSLIDKSFDTSVKLERMYSTNLLLRKENKQLKDSLQHINKQYLILDSTLNERINYIRLLRFKQIKVDSLKYELKTRKLN